MTCFPYIADGWGMGELWLEGTRLVWHELPRTRSPHPGRGPNPPPSRSTLPAKRAHGSNGSAPEVEHLVHRLERYFRVGGSAPVARRRPMPRLAEV